MSKPVALVTGACGEMGHLLLPALRSRGYATVALDLVALDPSLGECCEEVVQASILDDDAIRDIYRRHHPAIVFHLAAVLSTKAEKDPDLAHEVNVNGTVGLFKLCREEARASGRDVVMLFPSSIAVYGFPDASAKEKAGKVAEQDWNFPTAMYGCNKLYCELFGSYLTTRARRLREPGLDFRAIRFPGLISAETLPSGGTSDYGPEMIHAAAQGKTYACFVRADTRLPFMTMPDAVAAMMRLAAADAAALTTRVYNIGAFAPSAAEYRDLVMVHYPGARISFEPVAARQAIVDSWPADVDDSKARSDWGHAPVHALGDAIADYLVPALQRRYGARVAR
jgi:nucleoside-diphosphate-sugar epimerase